MLDQTTAPIIGARVSVTAGKHKGKTGTVDKPGKNPGIRFDDGTEGRVRPTSLEAVAEQEGERTTTPGPADKGQAGAVSRESTPPKAKQATSGDDKASVGDFVQSPSGGIDFGAITSKQAAAMRRQAGKIRLTQGVQNADGTGHGLAHIEANHGKQIRGAGFASAQEFVLHVAQNFNQIRAGNAGQLLVAVKDNREDIMFLQLQPAQDETGDYYRVNTAYPSRPGSLEKKGEKGHELLWDGSEPPSTATGTQSQFAADPVAQPVEGGPNALGQKQPGGNLTTPNTLDDFGERLEGARKFLPPSLKEDLGDEQIASQPLSKIWPADAHEGIEDPTAAALAFAARAEIPAKPRKAGKLRRWVEKVKSLRGIVQDTDIAQQLVEKRTGLHDLDDLFAKARLLAQLPRETWKRVGAVGEYPNAIRFDENRKKVAMPFSAVTIDGKTHRFDGDHIGPDEVQKVVELLGEAAPNTGGLTAADFEIRSYRSGDATFINRKGDRERRPLKIFTGEDAVKKARAWLADNADKAEAEWEKVKARDNVAKADTRRNENRARVGENRRDGKDVTEAMFEQAFGFRGVQFGNWVGQGKGAKDRQGLLNEAYDALLDLADILGIPSRAISLDGTLGLSLGARGSGRASAHFERDGLVINLTKTRGAGTLAHEWFHALDNYFSRKRGTDATKPRDGDFITYRPETVWVKNDGHLPRIVRLRTAFTSKTLREIIEANGQWDNNKTLDENADAFGWRRHPDYPQGVRPEVERAFAELVAALNASPMFNRAARLDKGAEDYWSRIIERGARSFENYVISKMAQRGWTNDSLANVRDWQGWAKLGKNQERYPYLRPEEEAPIVEAFDALFNTIESREDPETGNVALFNRTSSIVSGVKPIPRSRLDSLVEHLTRNQPDGQARVRIADRWADLPAEIRAEAERQGFDPATEAIPGVAYKGDVYLVHGYLTSEKLVEETVFHERVHQALRNNTSDPGSTQLRSALQSLYNKLGAIEGLRRAAKQAGVSSRPSERQGNALRQAMLREAKERGTPDLMAVSQANVARAVLTMEEFLADLEGGRAYESVPKTLQRKFHEALGRLRQWLRDNGFTRLAKALGQDLDTANLADLRALLWGIRQQAVGTGDAAVRFIRVWHDAPHSGIDGAQEATDAEVEALVSQTANEDGAPSAAELRAALKDYRDTERAYGGKPAYDKAKAEGRTKLNYRQWVQVRTTHFKRWFGDWEAVQARDALQNMEAVEVAGLPSNLDGDELRAEANRLYGQAAGKGPVTMRDGREVKLTTDGLKKTRNHSADGRVLDLLSSIREVLGDAHHVASVAHERANPGDAIRAWHYYGAKVVIRGKEVFAKLVVRESVNGQIYYDNDLSSLEEIGGRAGDAARTKTGAAAVSADKHSLSSLLEAGNPAEVSKVVDPKTGEPLVLFHGTNKIFNEFDAEAAGSSSLAKDAEGAFFFTDNPGVADDFSGYVYTRQGDEVVQSFLPGANTMPVFLNLRDPTVWEMDGGGYEEGFLASAMKEAKRDKSDGVVFLKMRDGSMFTVGPWKQSNVVAVFTSNQIKSAIGNVGTFDESADIRFSRPEQPGPRYLTDADAVRGAVRQVLDTWKGDKPVVRVVRSLAEARKQGAALPADAPVDAEGWWDGGSTVYLFTNNLKDVNRALEVLVHEAIGHYGIEGVMGPHAWKTLVADVQRLAGRDLAELSPKMRKVMQSAKNRYGNESPEVFAKEFLAIMAEQGVKNSMTARVLAAVRRFLERLGISVAEVRGFREAALLDALYHGRKRVMQGRAGQRQAAGQPAGAMAFARQENARQASETQAPDVRALDPDQIALLQSLGMLTNEQADLLEDGSEDAQARTAARRVLRGIAPTMTKAEIDAKLEALAQVKARLQDLKPAVKVPNIDGEMTPALKGRITRLGYFLQGFTQNNPDAFAYGQAAKGEQDIQKIAAAMLKETGDVPVFTQGATDNQGVQHWTIRSEDGRAGAFEVEPGGILQLHIGDFLQNSGEGSRLYAVFNTWAARNNYKALPDRGGLSKVNEFRRTSSMLSSALREGSTAHLAPHESQNLPHWVKGRGPNTTAFNIGYLALREAKRTLSPDTAKLRVHLLDKLRYDFDQNQFVDSKGRGISLGEYRAVLSQAAAGQGAVGGRTAQRALFAASSWSEAERRGISTGRDAQTWGGAVADASAQSGVRAAANSTGHAAGDPDALVLDGPVTMSRAFYSRPGSNTEAPANAGASASGDRVTGSTMRTHGIPASAGEPDFLFRNDQPLKRHPSYAAAKAGDMAAAVELVRDLAAPLQAVAQRHGSGVIYVAPHAEEASGRNKIPNTLAAYMASVAGAQMDTGIVQTNRAFHTGAKLMERLIARSDFGGPVERGARYVLVDDVTTGGSTLADLAAHIQANGGQVVGTVVMTNAARGGKMHATPAQLRMLERRLGDEIRTTLHIDPAALTAEEAGYLIGFRNADELRNRATAARQARIIRLRTKGIQLEAKPESSVSSDQPAPPRAGPGRSGGMFSRQVQSQAAHGAARRSAGRLQFPAQAILWKRHAHLVPEHRTLRHRPFAGHRAPPPVLRAMRQPRGQAGGDPARRAGWRLQSQDASFP